MMHRFSLLLIVLGLLAVDPAASLAQDDGGVLDVDGLPLSEALARAAQSRQLELAYAPEIVAGRTSICRTSALDPSVVLHCVLEETGLEALRLPNGVFVIRAQPRSAESDTLAAALPKGVIVGVVRDGETGDGLPGAHVVVSGTNSAAASGMDGTFTVTGVPAGSHDIEISMMGFAVKRIRYLEVTPDKQTVLEVELDETTIELGEVVVRSRQQEVLDDIAGTLDVGVQSARVGPVGVGILISARGARVRGVQVAGIGALARDSLSGAQVGALFSASGGPTHGAQFGGLINTVDGSLTGAQFGGLVNVTMRSTRGVQFGGVLNVSRTLRGFQAAGIGNVAHGPVHGVQAGGLFNAATQGAAGGQIGGIFNTAAGGFRGVQVGGLWNVAGGRPAGAQVAGVVNITGRGSGGVQTAGVVNVTRHSGGGVQLGGLANVATGNADVQTAGIVNIASDTVRALQVGLVDVAGSHRGIPIGLVSYVADVGLRFEVWMDETGMAATVIRSGTRRFSNFIGGGVHPTRERFRSAVVAGLGTEFRTFGSRSYGTVDLLYSGFSFKETMEMVRARLLLGFELGPYTAVFAGPTLNLLFSTGDDGDAIIPWSGRSGRWHARTRYDLWPGFVVGMRFTPPRLP